MAVIGYGLIRIDQDDISRLIDGLYFQTLKGYWDAERRYIDGGYQSIPFPFQEYVASQLQMTFV